MSDYWDYSFFNVSVIRYADVLLLYAECLNDKGETTEAINIINKVRARVNVPALPLTMGKAEVLKHLLRQRTSLRVGIGRFTLV